MSENTKTDVYYFLDYSRLLLDQEIRYGHHVNEYTRILEKIGTFVEEVTWKLDKMDEDALESMAHRLEGDVVSSVKDASNHTPVMRALLRAADAMRWFK